MVVSNPIMDILSQNYASKTVKLKFPQGFRYSFKFFTI